MLKQQVQSSQTYAGQRLKHRPTFCIRIHYSTGKCDDCNKVASLGYHRASFVHEFKLTLRAECNKLRLGE